MRNRLLHKHHEYVDEDIKGFITDFVEPLKTEILIRLDGKLVENIQTPDIEQCNLYQKQLVTVINERSDIKASNRSAEVIENDFRNSINFLKSFSDKGDFIENEYAGFYTLTILGELYDEIIFNKIRTNLSGQELEDLKYYYDTYHELSHSGDIDKSFKDDVVTEANYILDQQQPSVAPNTKFIPISKDQIKQNEQSNEL